MRSAESYTVKATASHAADTHPSFDMSSTCEVVLPVKSLFLNGAKLRCRKSSEQCSSRIALRTSLCSLLKYSATSRLSAIASPSTIASGDGGRRRWSERPMECNGKLCHCIRKRS